MHSRRTILWAWPVFAFLLAHLYLETGAITAGGYGFIPFAIMCLVQGAFLAFIWTRFAEVHHVWINPSPVRPQEAASCLLVSSVEQEVMDRTALSLGAYMDPQAYAMGGITAIEFAQAIGMLGKAARQEQITAIDIVP